MTGFRHGLLIGKFYPPHQGHHAVIRSAARQSAQLTVLVMASAVESIPLADRVRWLQAEHAGEPGVRVLGVRCDAPVDVGDDRVWAAQVAVMRSALRDVDAVDAVFSADGYGPELARRFDATFVGLDRPVGSPSGTAARADLAAAWPTLAAATRAGLATRVVVVGAESTGTTTVSQALADHYRARGGTWAAGGWVAEYGREYTGIKLARSPGVALDDLVWTPADFDAVGTEQNAREEAAARSGSPVLVCDTDAFATSVWERRYLGPAARGLRAWAQPPQLPRHDVYLLTDHEGVPWHDDGLREGDLAVRAAMTGWFADALTAAGHSWVLLTGSLDDRLALARRTVDALLRHRAALAEPFTGPGFERMR